MIQLNVKCPHCKHSLLEETYKIDGHPSVRLLFECKGKKDELYLNSLYGSHNSKIPSFVSEGAYVKNAMLRWC